MTFNILFIYQWVNHRDTYALNFSPLPSLNRPPQAVQLLGNLLFGSTGQVTYFLSSSVFNLLPLHRVQLVPSLWNTDSLVCGQTSACLLHPTWQLL